MGENALTGQVRSLRDIEADIWARKRSVTLDVLAMGRDLMEAKEQLEHGEWLAWLEKMDFGLRTAENWMRLAREVSPESSLAALPYTKALALLSAPAEEREQLAAEAGDKSAAEWKKRAQEAKAAREEASCGRPRPGRRTCGRSCSGCGRRRRSWRWSRRITTT